jgi:hypothetical protein
VVSWGLTRTTRERFMLHLSRLLATSCAISVILVSLPIDAGIGDKDLPPLNGQKTKLLYTVSGVTDTGALATVFHCTSTERDGGKTIELGIEVFDLFGSRANDVTAGDGVTSMPPGHTRTLSTHATVGFGNEAEINTGTVAQGSARIIASSKNVLCSAMLVDAVNNAPTSMVMLPVFRTTKQGGM